MQQAVARASETSALSAQPTVFLVDDDPDIRSVLRLALTHAGWSVDAYESAETFLECYRPERPGCLILDVTLPGLSGLELQQRLVARNWRIPIIFLSAHGDIPMSVRAIKTGAFDFLTKPYCRQELLHKIREAIRLDTQTRQRCARQRVVVERFARLTTREQQVMKQVVLGRSSKEIARQLGVSHRTVEIHRTRIMDKLETHSVAELVALAYGCGRLA